MTEPVGTAKSSLDVVLVSAGFAALMLLGMAGWSIWQGLLPYWDGNTFFFLAVAACLLCLSGCMNASDCEDSRPGVEVDLSGLRGEVEDLRQDVAAFRLRLDAAGL